MELLSLEALCPLGLPTWVSQMWIHRQRAKKLTEMCQALQHYVSHGAAGWDGMQQLSVDRPKFWNNRWPLGALMSLAFQVFMVFWDDDSSCVGDWRSPSQVGGGAWMQVWWLCARTWDNQTQFCVSVRLWGYLWREEFWSSPDSVTAHNWFVASGHSWVLVYSPRGAALFLHADMSRLVLLCQCELCSELCTGWNPVHVCMWYPTVPIKAASNALNGVGELMGRKD